MMIRVELLTSIERCEKAWPPSFFRLPAAHAGAAPGPGQEIILEGPRLPLDGGGGPGAEVGFFDQWRTCT